jgi:hypothetical protein
LITQFRPYPSAKLVWYTVEATTTNKQVREFLGAVLAHPHFRPGFDFLGESHTSDGDTLVASLALIALEAGARTDALGSGRWAFVVPGARVLETVCERIALFPPGAVDIAAFLTPGEAMDWLAREHPTAGPQTTTPL